MHGKANPHDRHGPPGIPHAATTTKTPQRSLHHSRPRALARPSSPTSTPKPPTPQPSFAGPCTTPPHTCTQATAPVHLQSTCHFLSAPRRHQPHNSRHAVYGTRAVHVPYKRAVHLTRPACARCPRCRGPPLRARRRVAPPPCPFWTVQTQCRRCAAASERSR